MDFKKYASCSTGQRALIRLPRNEPPTTTLALTRLSRNVYDLFENTEKLNRKTVRYIIFDYFRWHGDASPPPESIDTVINKCIFIIIIVWRTTRRRHTGRVRWSRRRRPHDACVVQYTINEILKERIRVISQYSKTGIRKYLRRC